MGGANPESRGAGLLREGWWGETHREAGWGAKKRPSRAWGFDWAGDIFWEWPRKPTGITEPPHIDGRSEVVRLGPEPSLERR